MSKTIHPGGCHKWQKLSGKSFIYERDGAIRIFIFLKRDWARVETCTFFPSFAKNAKFQDFSSQQKLFFPHGIAEIFAERMFPDRAQFLIKHQRNNFALSCPKPVLQVFFSFVSIQKTRFLEMFCQPWGMQCVSYLSVSQTDKHALTFHQLWWPHKHTSHPPLIIPAHHASKRGFCRRKYDSFFKDKQAWEFLGSDFEFSTFFS